MRKEFESINRDELTAAFKDLRKKGYFARQRFMCCGSCAAAAIPDDKSEKAIYYHAQDYTHMIESNTVYIGWAGNGNEICKVFRDHGFNVIWEGNENVRILITGKKIVQRDIIRL